MTKRQRALHAQLAKNMSDLKWSVWDRRLVASTRGVKFMKRKHNKAFRRFSNALACEADISPELARFRY